jgi:hypothetical protein
VRPPPPSSCEDFLTATRAGEAVDAWWEVRLGLGYVRVRVRVRVGVRVGVVIRVRVRIRSMLGGRSRRSSAGPQTCPRPKPIPN